MTLDGTFQTHILRTSSGPSSGPQVTNQGYPGLSQFIWWYPKYAVHPLLCLYIQVHITVYTYFFSRIWCILIWQICKNMHPHRAPLCWWCHCASPLQAGVGLTRMAATPRRQLPFCSGTLCGRRYGGWFSPSPGRRTGRYVHHVRVAPVTTRSGPQVTNPGYPGLSWSQCIW